ncbi:ATPase family associated with various cellular activities (AAA) domain-containing protein [Sarocladium implicatum]|nr:ATPase family associated with various cellular activities (AAA) domain-containing protein [Sarocladium implicatum]
MSDRRRVGDYVWEAVIYAGVLSAGYYLLQNLARPMIQSLQDPDKEKHDLARQRAEAHLEKLSRRRGNTADDSDDDDTDGSRHRRRIQEMKLNEYENLIALEMVAPESIPVGFNDIGGLDEIIEELKESVIYPLTMPHLYSHSAPLLSAPSGVLLFGPPGCGKTMLAKAVAKESGASFINLHISTMTEKWYGDSNKIVRAVFSLARKMQPSIIFIDEIDAVLGTRRSGEHEASGMVKAEFMTLWDGLTSANASGMPDQIVVLGATNRINDIDEAILRRMPKKFPVPLPSRAQRRRILQLILEGCKKDPEEFDIDYVANLTAGMSGSDIKEACRDAAMAPVREYMREHRSQDARAMARVDPGQFRGVRSSDFLARRGTQPPEKRKPRRESDRSAKEVSDGFEDVDEALVPGQD